MSMHRRRARRRAAAHRAELAHLAFVAAASPTFVPLTHADSTGKLTEEVPAGALGVLSQEEFARVAREMNTFISAHTRKMYRNVAWVLLPVAGIFVFAVKMHRHLVMTSAAVRRIAAEENRRLAAAGRSVRYVVDTTQSGMFIHLDLTEADARASAVFRTSGAVATATAKPVTVTATQAAAVDSSTKGVEGVPAPAVAGGPIAVVAARVAELPPAPASHTAPVA